jgi:hypothetical protein
MNESESVSMDNPEDVWDYIKDNPLLMGLPLSDNKGIDILSALRDVYETSKKNPEGARMLLTLLANILVASAQGEGNEVMEEIIVLDALANMDDDLKEILDEGQ